EPDQDPLRGGLAPQQGVPAAEVVLLGLQRDREPDAGLERVDLVAELVAGEDQAGFDPQDVQGIEAEGGQPVRRARLPDHIPERGRGAGVAPELVAELAGVTGPGDDQRQALGSPDPPYREPEPAETAEPQLGRPSTE